jgi:phosphatidylethanolamine/phosphatidyl-N-methylethanolamine N-methyltransferase
MGDTISFLRAWLSDPRLIGAVAPSSPMLAAAMTAEITPASSPVIELGAGTGALTWALLARGVPEEALALIDYGSDFVRMLQARFPRARTLWMDAARLKDVELFDGKGAGAAVSGLPLLLMPTKKIMAILDGVFTHLRTDGALYQFTYRPSCPVPRSVLDRLRLEATRVGGALINVPPASVYRIRRWSP